MGSLCENVNAELLEDEAYRFVMRAAQNATGPIYSYPTNGLPLLIEKPTSTDTSFMVAMRKHQ